MKNWSIDQFILKWWRINNKLSHCRPGVVGELCEQIIPTPLVVFILREQLSLSERTSSSSASLPHKQEPCVDTSDFTCSGDTGANPCFNLSQGHYWVHRPSKQADGAERRCEKEFPQSQIADSGKKSYLWNISASALLVLDFF